MQSSVTDAAQWQKLLVLPLVGRGLPSADLIGTQLATFEENHAKMTKAWSESYSEAFSNDLKKFQGAATPRSQEASRPKIRNNLAHGELLELTADFNSLLMAFPIHSNDEGTLPVGVLKAMLVPGFEGFPSKARWMLALRTALIMFLATALPLLDSRPHGDPLDWVQSDLLQDLAVFSPIAAIFVYQQRTQALIPDSSRVWRFAFGTYIACTWALWVVYFAGSTWWQLICLQLVSAGVGTYIHAHPYFGYTGLVLAFTVPIIVVGYEEGDREERRALARMVQTLLGCAITAAVTILWQTELEIAEPFLRKKLTRSTCDLKSVVESLESIQMLATSSPSQAKDKVIIWAEKARILRKQHTGGLKALIHEAAGEVSIYPRPAFPQHDFEQVVRYIANAWDAVTRMMNGLCDMVNAHSSISDLQSDHVLITFLQAAVRLSVPLQKTMRGICDALGRATLAQITKELLPSIVELQAATYNFWHHFDRDWAQLLVEYEVNLSSKNDQRSDGKPPLFTWLATTTSLAQMDYVARHVAGAAERMMAVTMTQSPPDIGHDDDREADDLYENEVDV